MNTKSLSTPFKIIKILKLMTENPSSINEILNSFEDDGIFISKETVSKYFATLREAGCNIQKRKNKFFIKYPILEFSDTEIETLKEFDKIVSNLNSKKKYSHFLKFLDKLFTLTNETASESYKRLKPAARNDFSEKLSKTYKDKIETISDFVTKNPQKLTVTCDNKDYSITPVKFQYYKNSICLTGYDTKENVNKNFPLSKISNIIQSPVKAPCTEFGLSTTFKITGRLKDAYNIRKGEIVGVYDDYIVVTNKKEDKDALFKRLLRYGTSCKILYPESDRKNFKALVEKLISAQNK